MKNLKKAKQLYQSSSIPPELSDRVQKSFLERKQTKYSIWRKRTIAGLATATAFCMTFIILVNTNSSFAKAVVEIPVLSKIASWVTVRELHEENETDVIHASIPNLANTGNTEFENKMNQKINEKIDQLINIARQENLEFKYMLEDYAGDYEEDYKYEPVYIDIDYEIKSQNNGIVSFVITEEQSDKMHANVHQEKFMYTIDLKQNKELTLADLLGDNYQEIANQEIQKQIKETLKIDNTAFFKEEDMPYAEHGWAFEGIEENQNFYLNEQGNVVIVFDKYSISPGYMGMPEFEIRKEQ